MEIKLVLKKIRDIYCYSDFFLGRGMGLFSSIYQIGKYIAIVGIIIELINRKFNVNIPIEKITLFVPFFILFMIFCGIMDVKKIHALQKGNEISTRFNPYLVNLIKNKEEKEV